MSIQLDELILGYAPIDEDHLVLIGILREIESSSQLNVDLMSRLRAYVNSHFKNEEVLMEQYSYDGLQEHRLEHAQMRGYIQCIETLVKGGYANAVSCTATLIRNWASSHMSKADRAMVEYLQSRLSRSSL